MNLKNFEFNNKGHLKIGNCDTVDLANLYGTPLYVMDEENIRNACKIYTNSIKKYYNNNGMALFASKALNCMEICRIINSENMGLDVVSGGEIYSAIKSGFPASKIHFHGNNKTLDELSMAIDNNIGRIVIDNSFEFENLDILTKNKKISTNVILRIKPDINADTHKFIKTGHKDSKFGFDIYTNEIFEIINKIQEHEYINFMGFSYHIGSQLFDLDVFINAANIAINFIKKLKNIKNIETKELNIGGGLGIKYNNSDKNIDYDYYIKNILNFIKNKFEKNNVKTPYIYIEPGRSIVGEAGITLYKIGAIKKVSNSKKYIFIDGGMTDNPRYMLYNSKYFIINANKANEIPDELVTVSGKCCESGDLLGENIMLKTPKSGDIIAVFCTGAYNYSMASNYNRNLKPAIIMVNDDSHKIIVKRQTFEELISQDI